MAEATPGLDAYRELETRFARLADLGGAMAVLSWDRSTMMPPGGAAARADQMTTLSVISHEVLTHWSMPGLLARADADQHLLDRWQRANLRQMRWHWIHANAVPADLVAAHAKATAACEMAWREARKADRFEEVRPLLAEVVNLTRQMGQAKGAALGLATYDALVDGFDPGMRSDRLDALFAELSAFLPDLLGRIREHQARQPKPEPIPGPFPVDAQKSLARHLMMTAGFDFDHGRLDVSAHPFSGGVPSDLRLTTRYDESDFASGMMGVLHETGHGLYEAGLPNDWRRQPVGEALGMSVHESQSLIIEMQACRSRPFVSFLARTAREAFGAAAGEAAWDEANVHRLYTRVEPGFIRVDADEVSYPAHVLLRYQLERALVADDLKLADLPGAWSDGMKRLLGIIPPDDRQGCLQDIHWYDGAIGYFPSYTVGALMAAQLMEAARDALPALDDALSEGDLSALVGWLRAHVHGLGRLHDTQELVVEATGRPLDTAAFRRHLERRYLEEAA